LKLGNREVIMILKFLFLLPLIILVISTQILTPLIYRYYEYWDYYFGPPPPDEVFDFIVVGAGSAGSVVANRLSKNNKILLLEAGGDPSPFTSIPLLTPENFILPENSWNYKTVPQKLSNQAMKDKKSFWPRGRALGGTSNLNYMLYIRGSPFDYDNWANLTNDSGWNYNNLLPYFKKSLDYNGAYKENEKHYGQTPYGYLHVERKRYESPLAKYFMDAVHELGYKEVDTNGGQQVGFGDAEVTQKHGSRHSTWKAFLENFQHRKNLVISRYSIATKIKLDSNNRAEGVFYMRHGKKRFARASKEVIICEGSVDSPKLLMLSGIGPKAHLNSIKPKVDLPVGQNLKDHITTSLFPFLINDTISTVPTRDFGLRTILDYVVNGYGFISSSQIPNKSWPDLQVYFMGFGFYPEFMSDYSKTTLYNETLTSRYMESLDGKELDAFGLIITLVRPKSVGQIQLKDKNWETPPLIDPKYLENPQDVKALVEGLKFTLKVSEETESFKRLDAKFVDLPNFPGCESFPARSDSYFACYIRHTAFTLYHPVGTCRMGPRDDSKSVVDSKLRVLKTQNLRVIDLSIAPEIVNGNTNAPAIMIGEKGADLVREYWSQQYLISYRDDAFLRNGYLQCYYSKHV
ncbi:Glucose dehydrogenase [FAD, quinone], partial [Folsomia candida]